MIKIELTNKPEELSDDVQKELTERFKADHKDQVWRQDYIREALRDMTNNKCAYSEAEFTNSSYLEIEHFRYKEKYEDLVVEWGNLLPACKTCNVCKGDLDVEETPIVNPLVDNPKDHLYVKALRLRGKDDKGKNTVIHLGLNLEPISKPRILLSLEITNSIWKLSEVWDDAKTNIKKRNCINNLYEIMVKCDKTHPYSAFLSTYLLYIDDSYKLLKSKIQSDNMWSDALQAKENELREIALPEN